MAIAEIRKITIIGQEENHCQIITKLSHLGVVQPRPLKENPPLSLYKKNEVSTREVEEILSKLQSIINFLGRFEKKGLGLSFFPSRVVVSEKDYRIWIDKFDWKNLYHKCRVWEKGIQDLAEDKNKLTDRKSSLEPWYELPFSPTHLEKSKYLSYQLIIAPREKEEKFEKQIRKEKEMEIYPLGEIGGKLYFLLIYLKEFQKKVDSVFQEYKVEKAGLILRDTPQVEIRQINSRISKIEEETSNILKESRKAAKNMVKIMALFDHFYNVLQENKASSCLGFSRYTFALKGWIKKEDIPRLKSELADSSLEVIIEKPDKKEEKHIPVALTNRRLWKPFELVTHLYGLPRYLEIDPTPFLAPFFAIFMALCLTDGGYGIILALLAYFIPRKMEVGKEGRKLFSILFLSGLVTIGVGIITGGIFGFHFSKLPAFLQAAQHLQLFNPMEQPMIFLAVALGLGIIHLLFGITLNFTEKLRKRDLASAFLDHLPWIILIVGLVLMLGPTAKNFLFPSLQRSSENLSSTNMSLSFSWENLSSVWSFLPVYSKVGTIMFLWGVVVLFFFAGRKSKNPFMRLAKGAYELYGLLQLLGDILSYSRLLALGLATSVIATVVNTIAGMMSSTPFIGPVLMVIILILGHLANLVINCLSGFIHTARLQFVEFFTKFYEGGGKEFSPLRREGKYLKIIS